MTKQDQIRAEITGRLVECIEKGVKPWRMPWMRSGGPKNATSGKAYRGVNVWHLAWHGLVNNFDVPVYATFNQWKGLGCSVKPRPATCPGGVYGCPIVFYNIVTKAAKDAPDDATPQRFPVLKSWTVFNFSQVTGPDDVMAKLRERFGMVNPTGGAVGIHDDAEKVIGNSGVTIKHGGDRAAYNPVDDFVMMPDRCRFSSLLSYYGTGFHELAHATGHSSRLNRCPKFDRFGSDAYALEELVAEMAGVYVLAGVGLPVDTELENHASYLDNWCRVLKGDNRVIFTASSAAQAAADYLLMRGGVLVQEGQEAPAE